MKNFISLIIVMLMLALLYVISQEFMQIIDLFFSETTYNLRGL